MKPGEVHSADSLWTCIYSKVAAYTTQKTPFGQSSLRRHASTTCHSRHRPANPTLEVSVGPKGYPFPGSGGEAR